MSSQACGVDFGTSNSAVALPDGRVLQIDPTAQTKSLFRSVLYFPDDSKDVFAGEEAITQYLEEFAGRFIQSIKSWLPSKAFHATQIRGRAFKLDDLVATMLRKIRERAEHAADTKLEAVVLGRPAVFSPDPALDELAQTRLKRASRQTRRCWWEISEQEPPTSR